MKVLSLFNGMNTGRIALENVGIKVDKYYSSEIKPYAIELTQHHHPDTIQLGDITKWREWPIDWADIDLILSGSPCQDLSIAGKRKGLKGENSSLFWVFIDILNHIRSLNQKVLFLQENVGSAPKPDVLLMSRALGVLPVQINSNLVTAQNRDRFYWSNIRTRTDWTGDVFTDIPQPADRKIFLKDIIESGEVDNSKSKTLTERDGKAYRCANQYTQDKFIKKRISDNRQMPTCVKDKSTAILESYGRQQSVIQKRAEKRFLTVVNTGEYLRLFTQTELERLQGFPDGWTSILSYNKASSLLGDGWTLPVIEHIFNFIPKPNEQLRP